MPAPFNPFTINRESKVLGPDGRPWQVSEGVESGYNLPHVWTFQSIIGAAWRSYYAGAHDDALYNDPEYARAMERDPLVMSIVQERSKATVNRKWHIEVNDERDPAQKAMANGLKLVVDQIPHKRQMFSYMLEGAIWAGRVGSQLKYQDQEMALPDWQNPQQKRKVRVPVPTGHQPIDGDKINYTYDGIPTIQVYNPKLNSIPNSASLPGTASRMIALVGDWRSNFIIHAHEIRDAPYWMSHRAGSIYGIGVRHTIYWLSWLKRELLSMILTYAERTGMGLRIWYYQAGNPASKAEVQLAAENQTDRTNILVPRQINQQGRSAEQVEFVESGSTIATLLMQVLQKFDDDIERYIIGQSMSSGVEATGLGSEGIAGFQETTKANLTEYDADNFGETLTTDLIRKLALWIYPKSLVQDGCPRFAFQVAPPSPEKILAAARQYFDMGGTLEDNSCRAVTGLPAPQDGDTVLSLAKQQQEQMQLQTQAAQKQAALGIQTGGSGGTGAESDPASEPADDDYDGVMKQLMGEPERNARNGSPLRYDRLADIKAAAAEVDPNPSPEQKKAGNYKMGHLTWKGLPITIETVKGGIRKGKSKAGVEWEVEMKDHYGYIKRTKSEADGDAVDVFICEDHPDSDIVFCVNQMKPSGKFDEHKFILGQTNLKDAKAAYLRNYSDGWTGMGDVVAMTIGQFRRWLEDADTGEKIKPEKYDAVQYARTPASSSGKPQDIARHHAALLHHHLGESAPLAVHHLMQRLKTDPSQARLHAAASSIRDALEPNEDDHEEVRQRILGSNRHNGHPTRFAMPEILRDISKAEAQRNPAGPMRLPHEAIAAEAMSRLGDDAHAKAMEVENDLAKEAESDHTRHHPRIVARRVSENIGSKRPAYR